MIKKFEAFSRWDKIKNKISNYKQYLDNKLLNAPVSNVIPQMGNITEVIYSEETIHTIYIISIGSKINLHINWVNNKSDINSIKTNGTIKVLTEEQFNKNNFTNDNIIKLSDFSGDIVYRRNNELGIYGSFSKYEKLI